MSADTSPLLINDKFEERFKENIKFLKNQLAFIDYVNEIVEKCPSCADKIRLVKQELQFSD